MPAKWFEKYCQKHYSQDSDPTEDSEFELFYELSEFDQEVDTEKAWKNVCNKLNVQKKSLTAVWKVAAAVLLAGSLSLVTYQQLFTSDHQLTELKAPNRPTKFRLADGSDVVLARNSQLLVDEKEFMTSRQVTLKGKAFFDVAKNQGTFTVLTTNGTIEVLGTQFDVNSAPDELAVAVYEGLVKVSNNQNSAQLAEGEKAYLTASKLIKGKIISSNEEGWRTGDFNFDNEPLKKVIPLLEEYYNVDIQSSKALLECKVTASFSQEPLTDVIKTLATVLNAKSKKSGNKISFTGKGC